MFSPPVQSVRGTTICIWFFSSSVIANVAWYIITFFYIFIIISASSPRPCIMIIFLNTLLTLDGPHSVLVTLSTCSLHLECCLFPSVFTCRIILILKDKIQMYFLMKPFMILQIELMYHSIDIYFSVMKTIIASLTQWTQVWANSRRW